MIKIKKSKNADTRSATKTVSKNELLEDTQKHIQDVRAGLAFFKGMLTESALGHDFTKVLHIKDFHKDFENFQKNNVPMTEGEWFKLHINTERHHLDRHVPDDVNLIDILERIADCVMAGKARSGSVYEDKLDPEIIIKAFKNTYKLLEENVEVEE